MQHLPDFAVLLYQQPDIASLCLNLQDEQGCQVPVLLAYCWHICVIGPVTPNTANAWREHASTKASAAIEPLREARTWMKTHWPDAEVIRERIKKAELQLEMQLLEEMEALVFSSTPGSPTPHSHPNLTGQIDDTLQGFSDYYGITMSEHERLLLSESCLSIAKNAD